MIKLNNEDWIQWDNQIKTFRAQINGIIYGKYSNEFETVQSIIDFIVLTLTEDQIQELNEEKINEG